MCLGIPGQITAFDESNDLLAVADIMGMPRSINIALLVDEGVQVGDWVIVHLGFAMERVDAAGAARARASLEMMGRPDPGPPATPTPSASDAAGFYEARVDGDPR